MRAEADSRLSGTRETEEQRNLSLLSIRTGTSLVSTRVQRELTKLDGHEVVHDREDSLLHFTSVFRSEDDQFISLEVERDGGGRSHTGGESIGGELTSVVDDEVWLAKVLELFSGRSDKHVVLRIGSWGKRLAANLGRERRTMNKAW
jgi:hypothetical protein